MTTEIKTDNGQALTSAVDVTNIKDKSKKDMELDLERLRYNILDMAKRHEKAFTDDEKRFIVNRIKMLEYNYKVLRNHYDEQFGLEELKDIAAAEEAADYGGYDYDVDDPEIRKRIGKSLSYNCGKWGYTKKETEALKELIPDIDEPVIF